MSIAESAVYAVLGYVVVFIGLVLLMAVVLLMGRIMTAKRKAAQEAVPAAPETAPVKAPAPGSAGEVKLFDVPDREAAMIMAIVADKMGVPLNELRFKSIREVK